MPPSAAYALNISHRARPRFMSSAYVLSTYIISGIIHQDCGRRIERCLVDVRVEKHMKTRFYIVSKGKGGWLKG